MEIKFKKIIVSVLIFIFVFSPVFIRKTNAFLGIGDIAFDPPAEISTGITSINTGITAVSTVTSAATDVAGATKEFGLDSVAWIIANLVIERMAASTVNWINSGFRGSPAFVTDPEAYFQDIGDKIAGQYIFSNPNLNFLCGPIQAKIRLALTQNYIQDRIWQCTLTDVGRNMDDFMNNFENGGWDNFFELTQRQQNNPIGAYLQAENELNLQIATRQGTKQKELDWGKGFMSFEVCGPEGRDPKDGVCIGRAEIATPGSVIENKLNEVLGSGTKKLEAADEINEIVSTLLNQLVSQVIGGIGKGLRGLSSPSSTGEKSITNQLTSSTEASTVSYFGETQNTSILDEPLPTPPAVEPIIDQNYPVFTGCDRADPSCVAP
ncbi:MAG: hypothetical protein AAB837_00555 [Patescibacteria group bacterium]